MKMNKLGAIICVPILTIAALSNLMLAETTTVEATSSGVETCAGISNG